jgi:hypothetical protein
MLNEFSLNIDTIEKHGRKSNYDHFLINFMDLS